MTTKLTNFDHSEITQQQALLLDWYHIVHEINGKVKFEELFLKQQLTRISYYKIAEETNAEIFDQFPGIPVLVIETLFSGSKRIEFNVVYDIERAVAAKFNYVYDENNDLICHEHIEVATDLPVQNETLKYYFDRSMDAEHELFKCIYLEDGNLDFCTYDAYSFQDTRTFWQDGIPGESDMETLAGFTGLTMQEMSYYLKANLF